MVLAAAERRPEIIRLLSDFGIFDVCTSKYSQSYYNIIYFVFSGRPGAQVGEKASDGSSALLAALKSGCADCEQLLLSMGADSIESDEDGQQRQLC